MIPPGGQKSKIAVPLFCSGFGKESASCSAPSEQRSEAKAKDADPDPSAFAALPKLFRTRWIVGVPAEPLHLADGSRIQVDLKQTKNIDSKPALIQRVRLAVSGDSELDVFEPGPCPRSESRPSERARQAAGQNSHAFRFP